MLHTYRITITRPGHLPRVRIKEFADIFAATQWAKNYYATSQVSIEIEQVRFVELTDLQQAALEVERAAQPQGAAA